jgi:hypothetical protein
VESADRAWRMDSRCSPETCCDTISSGDGIPPLTAFGADDAYRMDISHSVGITCTFSRLRPQAQRNHLSDCPRGHFNFRAGGLAARPPPPPLCPFSRRMAGRSRVDRVLPCCACMCAEPNRTGSQLLAIEKNVEFNSCNIVVSHLQGGGVDWALAAICIRVAGSLTMTLLRIALMVWWRSS